MARFIQLDCGHCFEVEALDYWMEMMAGNGTVKYKECPKCKALIMKCHRYMKQINSTLNDVNAIKALILKNENEYQAELDRLAADYNAFSVKLNEFETKSDGLFGILM